MRALLCLLCLSALGFAVPAHAGRDALRVIVQQQCLPDWLQHHDPAPCRLVELPAPDDRHGSVGSAGSVDAGYAVLADRKGGAHFLLIPLRTLGGIESPALLQGHVSNYFAAAWQARGQLDGRVPYPLQRAQVGLAINSRYSRGQDQLHIHIECQGAALHAALLARAATLGPHWTALTVADQGWLARRVMGATLEGIEPFRLLAAGVPGAREHMAFYTLIVAGMDYPQGPGFALLARRAFLRGGEALLDGGCAIATR
jgi:CDP-diacylglycerol pyrophosphatase